MFQNAIHNWKIYICMCSCAFTCKFQMEKKNVGVVFIFKESLGLMEFRLSLSNVPNKQIALRQTDTYNT